MDSIGCLPITSQGNWWALTAISMHISYVFSISMKEKSGEKVVQAYLSGIFVHKGGSIAILSNNGTEFKSRCDQPGIKGQYSNPCHPQGNLRIENVCNFPKRTVTKFLDSSNLEWDEHLPFAYYCYNIFPSSNGTEPKFYLMFGCELAEGHYLISTIVVDIMETTGVK